MNKQLNLQDVFLNQARKEKISITIYLTNGFQFKGKALLALCRTLGVEASASVAFGDGSNDIEMLRAAGLGVAMANADEAVKAAADCVTAGNEDCGVARKIGELLEKGRDSVWKN